MRLLPVKARGALIRINDHIWEALKRLACRDILLPRNLPHVQTSGRFRQFRPLDVASRPPESLIQVRYRLDVFSGVK